MVQRTVLKVHISCQKCKKKLLKAVSTLEGVDKIEVDEAKGTLTVTGNADPYEIIIRTRKAGKYAEVVSIGPASTKPAPGEEKPNPPCTGWQDVYHDPYTCPHCRQVYVIPTPVASPSCSIL